MRDEQFDVSVTIETERTWRYFTVTRTAQAASFLVERWPMQKRGPKYRSALKAMMDVMEQRKTVSVGPKPFVSAAKEAGVFVRDD
ncbi:DUF982 domain-containing protein [Mesorhizobium sp.]|uniref:DUF982 domain-containing protein n=1 Tax=Mesorhizobium sp. TaxID=1871066 RepID=UPI000FE37E23|nr:DUF982 domain-containing protein [Mesorhizobium sp.]RWN98688.1 MAG: DUF982 domain-containing protein [Mesorhizobium sp.]